MSGANSQKTAGPLQLSPVLNEDLSVCHSLSLKQFQGFELHCDLFYISLLAYFLTCFNVLFLDVVLLLFNVFQMQFVVSLHVTVCLCEALWNCLVSELCFTNKLALSYFCSAPPVGMCLVLSPSSG